MSKKNIIIPPSLSWNEKQLKLYYQLSKREDVVFAYYWTCDKSFPVYAGVFSKKWIAEPCKFQRANKLPNGETFSAKYACSKYALHATHKPSFWSTNKNEGKLWIVAMCGKVIKHDKKIISQKRVIIGEVPINEFEKRQLLVKDIYSWNIKF